MLLNLSIKKVKQNEEKYGLISGMVLKRSENFRPSAVRPPTSQVISVRPTKKTYPDFFLVGRTEITWEVRGRTAEGRTGAKSGEVFFGRMEGRTADGGQKEK